MDPAEDVTGRTGGNLTQRRLANYEHLSDIELELTVELGRKEMSLEELGRLREQDVIELDKLAGESMEVRVNDQLFALSEIVIVTEMVACRLTSLPRPTASGGAGLAG